MLADTEGQSDSRYQWNKMWLARVCCVIHHVCKPIYFRWIGLCWISGRLWYQIRTDSKGKNVWPTFCPSQLCNEATLWKFTTAHWLTSESLVSFSFPSLQKIKKTLKICQEKADVISKVCSLLLVLSVHHEHVLTHYHSFILTNSLLNRQI